MGNFKLISFFIFLILFSFCSTAETTLQIDPNKKYQIIDGFGASDAWSMEPIGEYWSLENKNKIADLLFSLDKGIGLSIWRFNIGAGSTYTDKSIITNPWRMTECFKEKETSDYDWSKQAGQQWFLQVAKDRGVEKFEAFINSPPVWLTKNGHGQCDDAVGSTNLKAGKETDFAKFAIDVVKHFIDAGFPIIYISPINEPTWDWNKSNQEGCRYNNEDAKKVYQAFYNELHSRKLNDQIEIDGVDGVEINAMLDDSYYKEFSGNDQYKGGCNSDFKKYPGKYKNYIQDFLGSSGISQILSNKVSYHSYWSDYSKIGDDRLGKLRDIYRENIDKYTPNAKVWMSEYCILGNYGLGRDLGISPALYAAKVIHRDLTRVNVSAWFWWTAVSKEDYKDGLIYTDFTKEGDKQNIIQSKLLWMLGNYSKFIRPGSQRIECKGADNIKGLLASSFISADKKSIIIVAINENKHNEKLKFNFTASKPKTLTPYITNTLNDLSMEKSFDTSKGYLMEGRSIVTFIGQIN